MAKKKEASATPEKREFQTEIKQLLHLFIHSLYTKKEIYVRELVSNAADALDKIRFIELTSKDEILDKDSELGIEISLDEKNSTFTIRDNGIGMTHDELIQNLGTIAKSGSLEFIKKLQEEKGKADVNLIGQFGVGFYSSFMVAKKVTVRTKSYKVGEDAYEWVSEGEGDYVLNPIEKKERGTEIILELKNEDKEYATKTRIEHIIKTYSNFVPFDIKIDKEIINHQTALWSKNKSELKEEDYHNFYKYLTNDHNKPLVYEHISVEGNMQFKSILYIPEKNYELNGMQKVEHGLALYSNNVLIIPDCKKLLPQYFRFIRGVVDSEDISLNVSREMLQDSDVMHKIQSNLTKKVISTLTKMAEKDSEKYSGFWKEYGRIIKEGVNIDFENREKLTGLLMFNSSSCPDSEKLISLKDYVNTFVEGQKDIFYISGTDRETLERSPHLEIFKKKNIEVLYLTDPMDDIVLSSLMKFDGKDIKSVDQANLESIKDISKDKDEPEVIDDASEKEFNEFLSFCKSSLGEKIKDVKKSDRLTDSPCILVNPDGSISSHMQKVMQMMDKNFKVSPKILELNAKHPLIINLSKVYQKSPREDFLKDSVFQLYEGSLLQEGVILDPKETVPRIFNMVEKASGLFLNTSK
ncbi:MAG: molecular chaperone HtpG [Nitrospinae bacterium]|nr:molecular chaperone HtpG [Nitrospinota bacterium]